MLEPFELKDDNATVETKPERPLSLEEEQRVKAMLDRVPKPGDRQRLELLLLERLRQHKSELAGTLKTMSDHWTYEDHYYRYYHGSYKVYRTQDTTEQAVKLLRQLLPERKLNMSFAQIIRDGTGKLFQVEHNRDWDQHTRPMLEAFAHAKFMIEMAVRYAGLPEPPHPLPSGWAALLYLYDLR